MDWLGENEIPFVMVFTKMDKMSKKQFADNMLHYKEEMEKQWDELPRCFYTSSEKKEGRKELMDFISDANRVFKK